jgi:hypothetical protein
VATGDPNAPATPSEKQKQRVPEEFGRGPTEARVSYIMPNQNVPYFGAVNLVQLANRVYHSLMYIKLP